MLFEFATAARIVFGAGSAAAVAPAAASMGRRALVVTGRPEERARALVGDMPAEVFPVAGEPAVDLVRDGVRAARGCDVVIGFGGGSAIDAGKAIAVLMTNGGEPLDYLEVVGAGRPLENPSAPFIAVPTTAGTGSEVTRNAVLGSAGHGVKASLRSPHMLPRLAVVDAELTLDLPSDITASTGLDALTQLIEPYVCSRSNPLTDMFCVEGMRRVARSLLTACREGGRLDAREDMSLAALLGGLCLANAGLGVVHGLAAPIGGSYHAPHGAVCAALLPHGMRANIRALTERAPESPALARYAEVARLLTGRPEAAAGDGVEWVASLCAALAIPPLRVYGLRSGDVPAIAARAARASSMKANPVALTTSELESILETTL